MNRATRMLEVLRDGQRHSRRDLFERCGFFLTNNAASELRAQGHDIEQTRERVNGDVVYFYRLRGSLDERGDELSAGPESPRSSSESLSEGASQPALALGSRPVGGGRKPVAPSESEQLVASSSEPDQSSASLLGDGKHDHAHGGRSGSEGESDQDLLFPSTSHKAPPWA